MTQTQREANTIKFIFDGTYPEDSDGDVVVSDRLISNGEFILQFLPVDGKFFSSENNLKSLKGAPEYVGGNFSCNHNQLGNLEGAPEYVGGNFSCNHNQLGNLEGAPEYVGGNFYCKNNLLPADVQKPEGVKGEFLK